MSAVIEALYIYDDLNNPILEHNYRSRPPPATTLLSLFLAHLPPRPSLIYLPDASPPVSVFSVVHSHLLFLVPCSTDAEPLLVLEFLHRVIDALEEFLGAPLLSSKIQNGYDVVAQLLNEMCDAGIVCNTEPNALQEAVEVPGWMGKLLSGVGLQGTTPLNQAMIAPPKAVASAPAIPWRRQGVRHTSNELYVDIVESLSATFAPSGRPISAFVNGTIVFNSQISGVPDLLLTLTTPAGQKNLAQRLELPVFHPCVRLARWREKPGELSFVPPDGRFILGAYEVNLLPIDVDRDTPPTRTEKVFLPATVDIQKSLGPTASSFEVRLTLNTNYPGVSSRRGGGIGGTGGVGNLSGRGSGSSTPSFLGVVSIGGSSSSPTLEDLVVTVPIPPSVRNITDIQTSRGEAHFVPGSHVLEWRVPTKDAGSISGTATLKATIQRSPSDLDDNEEDAVDGSGEYHAHRALSNPLLGYYDESLAGTTASYQDTSHPLKQLASDGSSQSKTGDVSNVIKQHRRKQAIAPSMPSSASVSFTVRGWLPSGIRVDGLVVDPRKSRGLGEGVKPFKGVKYICVSRQGVEKRC